MQHKFSKFLSFVKAFLQQPALANLVIKDNSVFRQKFEQKYPGKSALPQIKTSQLGKLPEHTVTSFLMDGSSWVTDMQLLQTIAARPDVESYLEIGTWRGESVHNVAKILADCTTINLPADELRKSGADEKYITQHAILSSKNPAIKHIEANSATFDFASLNRKYDVVFVDGDHSYEMVLNDTKKVFQHLLKPNSIVIWHDYAFNPQKIRYEVYKAILDGIPSELHQFLYHPKNTLCAVFCREKLASSPFDEMPFPDSIYEININSKTFQQG